MNDETETKVIGFCDLLFIFKTKHYDTQVNYLKDFASKILNNLQYLHFLYLDQLHFSFAIKR